MLTAEVFGTGRTTGEVRPPRCKMGRNRAAGAHQGGRGGEHAAMEAAIAPFRLPLDRSLAILALIKANGPPIWEMSVDKLVLVTLPPKNVSQG